MKERSQSLPRWKRKKTMDDRKNEKESGQGGKSLRTCDTGVRIFTSHYIRTNERAITIPSQIEVAENHWVIGKMKENQGGAESSFALVTQANGIFTSHCIETNERAITIHSQIEEAEKHWVIGKMKENQGDAKVSSH